MLGGMKRSWPRRALTSILGVVFAVSMSLSAVQTMGMAAKMTMAATAGVAASDGKCPDCDHGGRDTKAMDCRFAACGTPSVATLASVLAMIARIDSLDRPLPVQLSLVGWVHPPDPYPPRVRAFD